jgi:hypothetical protein
LGFIATACGYWLAVVARSPGRNMAHRNSSRSDRLALEDDAASQLADRAKTPR